MNLHNFGIISKMLPQVVFVLGGPGSGKGTNCEKIEKKFGFVHLSAGDLLRQEVKRENSPYKKQFEEVTLSGKLMPAEVTVDLLKIAMEQSEKKKFLIDGFPRNMDNLNAWNAEMTDKVNLLFVLSLICNEEICVKRAMARKRADDTVDILKKRYIFHMNDTEPVLQYYNQQKLVRNIDATQNFEDMFKDITDLFVKLEN